MVIKSKVLGYMAIIHGLVLQMMKLAKLLIMVLGDMIMVEILAYA